jgi:hypothetical protein
VLEVLEPKTFTWERLNDGSKVTLKLEYHDGKAYCSIKVEIISLALEQKLSQPKGQDEIYRARFSTRAGAVVLDTAFLAGFGWYKTYVGTANIWLLP